MSPEERSASHWLATRSPGAHRVLRGSWHAARRLAGRPAYADRRRGMAYYAEAVRLAREYAPAGGSALDVGAHDSDVLSRLDWFGRRVALDRDYFPPRPGIERVVADFMEYEPTRRFDLVVCLQVLMAQPDPAGFARRLLNAGDVVILSIPGARTTGPWADRDPIAELREWTGREPSETIRVRDDLERVIGVYASGRAGSIPASSSARSRSE